MREPSKQADAEVLYTSTTRLTEIKVGQAFTLDSLLGESFPPSLCFRGFRIFVEGMCHFASVDREEKADCGEVQVMNRQHKS